ncbi:MAG: tetratricopeptide repeat protein [Clostridia bacterium]|nr:tetratricopeptide repeat protein [Clostridia bacterium]
MIFGIELWRITLIVVLIFLVVQRANLVAVAAKAQYRKEDYEGARKLLRIADKVGNLNTNNKLLLGYTCLRCGRLEEARVQFNLAMNLFPRDSAERNRVRNLLSLVSWKEGNLTDAIEILEDVMASGYCTTQIYQNLGIFYNLTEDKEKALTFNQEAYAYNEDDAIICDNLADAYASCGEYQKAAEVYEQLMARPIKPDFPEAYYGYGKVLIALGKKEEGVSMIGQSLTKPFSYLSICSREEVQALYQQYTD